MHFKSSFSQKFGDGLLAAGSCGLCVIPEIFERDFGILSSKLGARFNEH